MSTTIFQAQVDIETRINAAAWPEPVAYPHVAFTAPDPESPWVKLDLLWGDTEEISMKPTQGNRTVGVIQLTAFAPRGNGHAVLSALCDKVRDLFNRQSFGTVRCRAASGAVPVSDDKWEAAAVRIGFETIESVP